MVKEPQLGILRQKSSRLPNHSGLLQVVFPILFEIFPCLRREVAIIFSLLFIVIIFFPCLPREGEMHVCENNCALTLEDEIKFWGLDDALLQVAAIFVSSVHLFEIKFWGLDDALLQVTTTSTIHCVSSAYLFEVKF